MTLRPDHFDAIYAGNPDPWGYRSSAYEREKYDHTLASLPRDRYAAGLEVGCSIGVLTERLAARCDRLLGIDFAEHAVREAGLRSAGLPQVSIARRDVSTDWPDGRFDLIVLSEVLYFLSPADLARVAQQAAAALLPGGTVLLVNWLGQAAGELSGDEAAGAFITAFGAPSQTWLSERRPGYRLDRHPR